MKVLFVGHFVQDSGWSMAARNYLLAMDSVGIDVVCRPIILNGPHCELPDRLMYLSQKPLNNCTHIIQHILPHYMQYDGTKKNIGLYVLESHNTQLTKWPQHLNLMDEVWVPCKEMANHRLDNGLTKPVKIVSHAFDLTKYKQDYPPLGIPDLQGNYTFYYIGELNKRKNIEALVTAFHAEFGVNEPVSLLLKVSGPDKTPEHMSTLCNSVKESLRIQGDINLYKKEIVISQRLTETDLMSLHKTCNCFVLPSHGEAWSIPAFEAMAFGNPVIASKYGGPTDFCHPNLLVEGQENICTDMHSTFPGLNTGHERWFDINIPHLMKLMRHCYETNTSKYSDWQIAKAQEFSYQKIGQRIKKLLNEPTK